MADKFRLIKCGSRLGIFLLCLPFFLIYLGFSLFKNACRGSYPGETR